MFRRWRTAYGQEVRGQLRFPAQPRAKHISQSYRDAVRLGPLRSEEQLRRLVAESGASVIENLKAIYSGLAVSGA